MSSLEQRLAAVTTTTANLIAQLIELNRLRDAVSIKRPPKLGSPSGRECYSRHRC